MNGKQWCVERVNALTCQLGTGGIDDNGAQSGWLIAHAEGVESEGEGTHDDSSFAKPEEVTNSSMREQTTREEKHTVRKLTPLECERLQSWPDNWTLIGVTDTGEQITLPKTHRYRITGNGIVSNITEWIGGRIKETHDRHIGT